MSYNIKVDGGRRIVAGNPDNATLTEAAAKIVNIDENGNIDAEHVSYENSNVENELGTINTKLSDNADYLKGVNLFRDYDTMGLYSRSSETYNGYSSIYSGSAWGGAYQNDLVLKANKTYTISAYTKGSGGLVIYASGTSTVQIFTKALTSTWTRFEKTITPTEDLAAIRIENNSSEGIYIACYQIEEGSSASEYQPYRKSNVQITNELSNLIKTKNVGTITLDESGRYKWTTSDKNIITLSVYDSDGNIWTSFKYQNQYWVRGLNGANMTLLGAIPVTLTIYYIEL